jgi:hypothetical protein
VLVQYLRCGFVGGGYLGGLTLGGFGQGL